MFRIYKTYFYPDDYPVGVAVEKNGRYFIWTRRKHTTINRCRVKEIRLFGIFKIYHLK